MMMLMLIFITTLILLFVSLMSLTQLRSLADGTTYIDSLKHAATKEASSSKQGWGNIRQILGPPQTWLWPRTGAFPPELGGASPPARVEPAIISKAARDVESG